MAIPSVTYPNFVNGTHADGPQVSQNFTDLINAMSDGTKDFSIAGLTVNGQTTYGGNLLPSADATYDFGSSSLRFATLYLSGTLTVPGTLTVTGSIAGSRVIVPLGGFSGSSLTTDGYIGMAYALSSPSATASWNYVAPRAGSIVGYSVGVVCTARTDSHVFKINIYKNEALVITGNTITTTATGNFADRATATRGTYTFAAGDRIEGYFDYTSGSAANALILNAMVELQFDT